MSNYLAIAAATSTLGQLLEKAAGVLDGAKVTIGRPKEGTPTGINLFLYEVNHNAAWRNADLPARRSGGTVVQRPQAALDLHYLLTFYGAETKLEPQILMGSVVSVLHNQPVLTQEMVRREIERCIAEDPEHYLAAADLADQVERIRFTPLTMNLEELSKLWSVFLQVPYTLSLAYQASVVLVEADVVPQTALPVRTPALYIRTFRQPVIEKVEDEEGRNVPIVASSNIIITGRQLKGDITKVRIGEAEVTIPATDPANTVSDARIRLSLGSSLFTGKSIRAGVRGLQVVHPVMMGVPAVEHYGVESNVEPFVMHPTIAVQAVSSSELTLTFSPEVGRNQRVIALLNEFNTAAPRAYTLRAPSDNGIADESETETDAITFSLDDVEAGEYLVRVQVDGAESPLGVDADPSNPRYINPRIVVP